MQLPELGEDEVEARLHLFVRIKDDGPAPVVSKSSGQRQAQFAACRFLTLSLMKAHPDLVKLGLAHDAGQTEQQTVVVGARVVEALAIRDQHPEHRAELKQLMPIAIVAGEPRSVEADYEPGIAEADLGDQFLEALALHTASA